MHFKKLYIQIILLLFVVNSISAQIVSTVAGTIGVTGTKDSVAFLSKFNNPHGVEVDKNGNVFVADRYNHLIRKIDSVGNVSTIAGTGVAGKIDGQGVNASFNEPWGLTLDTSGNIYVADTKNNKIRKITKTGLVSTIAGTGNFGITDANNPLAASFGNPTGIAIDPSGNLYVADHLTHLIRKISKTGVVSTLAGNRNYPNNNGLVDGLGQGAKFYRPYGIELDRFGNLYVADEWNHAIRKVNAIGLVSTLAGNGTVGDTNGIGTNALFNFPWDVAIDSMGIVYVCDGRNFVIRKIETNLQVSTYAGRMGVSGGVDGFANVATFNGATSLSINTSNTTLYVGDAYNQLVRKITIVSDLGKPVISIQNKFSVTDTVSVCDNEKSLLSIHGKYDYYNVYLDSNLISSTYDTLVDLSGLPVGLNNIYVVGVKQGNINSTSDLLYLKVKFSISTKIKASAYTVLCEGDSLKLFTTDNSIIKWNTGVISDTITAKTTGKYFIDKDSNSCYLYKDTILLIFSPKPNVAITTQNVGPYYEGDTVMLNASGANQYVWNTGSVGNTISITQNNALSVRGKNNFGCSSVSDTIQINFITKPLQLKVLYNHPPNGLIICEGDSIALTMNKTSLTSTWIKDGLNLNTNNPTLNVYNSGKYYFRQIDSLQHFIYSDTVFVRVISIPIIDFSADKVLLNKEYNTVQFTPLLSGAYSYLWNFGDTFSSSGNSTEINPSYTYSNPGLFTVNLISID